MRIYQRIKRKRAMKRLRQTLNRMGYANAHLSDESLEAQLDVQTEAFRKLAKLGGINCEQLAKNIKRGMGMRNES